MGRDKIIARPVRQAEYGEPLPVTIEDMLNEISNQGPAIPAVMDSVQPQLEALDPALLQRPPTSTLQAVATPTLPAWPPAMPSPATPAFPPKHSKPSSSVAIPPSSFLPAPSSSVSPTPAKPPAPSKRSLTPAWAAPLPLQSPAIRRAGSRRKPTLSSTKASGSPGS